MDGAICTGPEGCVSDTFYSDVVDVDFARRFCLEVGRIMDEILYHDDQKSKFIIIPNSGCQRNQVSFNEGRDVIRNGQTARMRATEFFGRRYARNSDTVIFVCAEGMNMRGVSEEDFVRLTWVWALIFVLRMFVMVMPDDARRNESLYLMAVVRIILNSHEVDDDSVIFNDVFALMMKTNLRDAKLDVERNIERMLERNAHLSGATIAMMTLQCNANSVVPFRLPMPTTTEALLDCAFHVLSRVQLEGVEPAHTA